ncbi:Poly(A) polymerase, putative [Phytophthora infestans T30-4]|uniref:Poly(A) polymerase, putative n=2 Tax=Phytophthora infestans TaxID=4787 RepID=D0N434_PHYIT|nr:Poly(A) polymerase, putative [Phytophthora infestans T30-4]EEY69138.1 Poly(A) polymerase, putative [Phytophthora infestans T30-4]KAF4132982.1 Cid1 family poly A polymerase [Phytophthora infestans]|eukprot:XP_002998992.1 Poly(A) polymerase, putative [Phytophthora infestans T30-4]
MEAPATAITQPRSRPQSSIPERNQNSQNARLKLQLKSSSNEAHSDVVGDYRDASWFKAGEGDLIFAQWLLGRCNGVGDATTPKSEAATQRMFALFKTQRRLRQELALGSKREVVSVEEEEEGDIEGEEERAADAEEPLWCVEELVEQVGDVLRPSRRDFQKQQREAEKNNAKVEGAMERIVVAEVVDNATELILSRATREHETLLRRWVEVLKEEEAKKTEEGATDFIPEVEGKNDEVTPPKSKKRDKKEKKARVKKNKSKVAEDTACEQVESFLTFLRESAATQTHVEACVTAAPSKAEKLWMSELQRIVEVSSIEPEEEARRLRVASDIETVLRHGVSKWRHCEVILFGSSMTHYGSRTSDLDMCLLPHGRSSKNDSSSPNEVIGKRQLQRLIDGKATENGHVRTTESEQLLDLHAQTHKSIEKLTQALNSLDRSGKNGDKQTKQRRQLEFFNAQMRLLRSAILADLAKLGVAEPSNDSNASGKAAHLRAIIADSRRQSKDLYLVRAILERAAKCEVRHVIAGARVPIIRFLHTRSGRDYECDLCFDNVLATWNTPLLRAYASFDDRARTLGLAVKHWAKQRGISDASMGFLSSYSFVLLSIYYLQVVRVLPNLQAPGLLQSAQIQPQFYNDINIAFCEDRAVAQAFLERSLEGNSSDMSLATLLVGFFAYYATQFDFAERVVTVRSPETPALKLGQWGSRKAKTWRMSIQDPLETGRDLGCVLQFKGQERIIHELRRAHELLARGESFSDEVCAVEKPAGRTGKAKQSKQAAGDDFVASEEQRQPNQQQTNKMKRSYVMVLQSADEELTKEIIEVLFKDFQKSFRVGKVEEAAADGGSENKNKRWEVELLTQAQNCPRKLSLRTRIDWKAADGRVGRVWVHHQALFATPPCLKCLSPEHGTGKCVPDDLNEVDDDLKGDNDEVHIPQKNIRRHVLRVAIGGDHSSAPGKKNDRRKKKQQQHGAARDSHHIGQPKSNKNVKRRNSDKSSGSGTKESHEDKKAEATEVTAVRRVETVEKSSSTSRFKGDSNKTTQKKKKWQQRAHRKRGDSKRDSKNAAAE